MSRIDFLTNRNMFDNPDMRISQRYGGTNVTGATTSSNFVADRWAIGIFGSPYQYAHELRGAGHPTISDGIVHPIVNYLQIRSENVRVPPTAENFSIFHRMESTRIIPFTYRRMKIGFLVNTNKAGTYTAAFYGSASNNTTKYLAGFTINEINSWQKVVLEIDMAPMHGLFSYVDDFESGLQMNIFFATGPDITGVEPENQWIDTATIGTTQARGVAGQVNFFAESGNIFNVTGFRAIPLDYAGQEVDLWATIPNDLAYDIRICQRYFEKSYDLGVTPGSPGEKGGVIYERFPSSATAKLTYDFQETKVAIPIMAYFNPITGASGTWDVAGVANAPVDVYTGTSRFSVSITAGDNAISEGHWTADAEL